MINQAKNFPLLDQTKYNQYELFKFLLQTYITTDTINEIQGFKVHTDYVQCCILFKGDSQTLSLQCAQNVFALREPLVSCSASLSRVPVCITVCMSRPVTV